VAGCTNPFPSVRPPLLNTKFENFWSNSGATKSRISTGGLGVCETSLANIFHGTFATQESWFQLDEDIGHQKLTKRYLQLEAFTKVRGITKYSMLNRIFDLHTWAACVQLAHIMQIMYQTHTRNFGIDVMPLKSIQLKTPWLNEYSSLDMNREMYSVIQEIVHFVFSFKPQNARF
jgi:hypothetical protein